MGSRKWSDLEGFRRGLCLGMLLPANDDLLREEVFRLFGEVKTKEEDERPAVE